MHLFLYDGICVTPALKFQKPQRGSVLVWPHLYYHLFCFWIFVILCSTLKNILHTHRAGDVLAFQQGFAMEVTVKPVGRIATRTTQLSSNRILSIYKFTFSTNYLMEYLFFKHSCKYWILLVLSFCHVTSGALFSISILIISHFLLCTLPSPYEHSCLYASTTWL